MIRVSYMYSADMFDAIRKEKALKRKILAIVEFSLLIFVAFSSICRAFYKRSFFDINGFFIIFSLVMIIISLRNRYRNSPHKIFERIEEKYPGLRVNVQFMADGFLMDSSSAVSSKSSSYSYSVIDKANEREGWFLILISNSGYLAFRDNDIIEGSANELRSLLREKLGAKYKV
ncbi:MAG TPA: hypothetical protein P5191_14710 [Ruminococcus sp.]|nr:hypothetical protein [Ruminococcus sp.]